MIHYFGGPITPVTAALKAWRGRHAFVSYAHPTQITVASDVCQSFALDNGAFSLWKAGKATDWSGFYEWVDRWRCDPGFDFAVVPDVIDGTESQNDDLAEQWPFPRYQGAVVWHTNESISRLVRLAQNWPTVCIGSSGEYDVSSPSRFLERAFEAVTAVTGKYGKPICKLHGLRMLNPKIFTHLPLSSADSTNLARNISIDKNWKGTYDPKNPETRAQIIAERTESENGLSKLPLSSMRWRKS